MSAVTMGTRDELAKDRQRQQQLELKRESAQKALLDDIDELLLDFHHDPAQVGLYLAELSEQGSLEAGELEAIADHIAGRAGVSAADRVFGYERPPAAPATDLVASMQGERVERTIAASHTRRDAEVDGALETYRERRAASGLTTDRLATTLALARSLVRASIELANNTFSAMASSAPEAQASLRDALAQRVADDVASRLGLGPVPLQLGEEGQRRASAHGARGVMDAGQVYLDTRTFDPAHTDGRELIAHEVAHVAQRSLAPAPAAYATTLAEADAHRFAGAYAKGEHAQLEFGVPAGHVAREEPGGEFPAIEPIPDFVSCPIDYDRDILTEKFGVKVLEALDLLVTDPLFDELVALQPGGEADTATDGTDTSSTDTSTDTSETDTSATDDEFGSCEDTDPSEPAAEPARTEEEILEELRETDVYKALLDRRVMSFPTSNTDLEIVLGDAWDTKISEALYENDQEKAAIDVIDAAVTDDASFTAWLDETLYADHDAAKQAIGDSLPADPDVMYPEMSLEDLISACESEPIDLSCLENYPVCEMPEPLLSDFPEELPATPGVEDITNLDPAQLCTIDDGMSWEGEFVGAKEDMFWDRASLVGQTMLSGALGPFFQGFVKTGAETLVLDLGATIIEAKLADKLVQWFPKTGAATSKIPVVGAVVGLVLDGYALSQGQYFAEFTAGQKDADEFVAAMKEAFSEGGSASDYWNAASEFCSLVANVSRMAAKICGTLSAILFVCAFIGSFFAGAGAGLIPVAQGLALANTGLGLLALAMEGLSMVFSAVAAMSVPTDELDTQLELTRERSAEFGSKLGDFAGDATASAAREGVAQEIEDRRNAAKDGDGGGTPDVDPAQGGDAPPAGGDGSGKADAEAVGTENKTDADTGEQAHNDVESGNVDDLNTGAAHTTGRILLTTAKSFLFKASGLEIMSQFGWDPGGLASKFKAGQENLEAIEQQTKDILAEQSKKQAAEQAVTDAQGAVDAHAAELSDAKTAATAATQAAGEAEALAIEREATVTEAMAVVTDAETGVRQAQEARDEASTRATQAETAATDATTLHTETVGEHATTLQQVNDANTDIVNATSDVERNQLVIGLAIEDMNVVGAQATAASKAVELAEHQVSAAQAQMDAGHEGYKAAVENSKAAAFETVHAQDRRDRAQAQAEAAAAWVTHIEQAGAEIDSVKDAFGGDLEAANAQIEKLTLDLADATSEFQMERQAVMEARNEGGAWDGVEDDATFADALAAMNAAGADADAIKQELAAAKTSAAAIESSIEKLQVQAEQVATDHAAAMSMLQDAGDAYVAADTELAEAHALYKASEGEVETALEQVGVASQGLDTAEQTLASATSDLETLQSEIQAINGAAERAKSDLETAKSDLETAKQSLEAAETARDDAARRVEEAKTAAREAGEASDTRAEELATSERLLKEAQSNLTDAKGLRDQAELALSQIDYTPLATAEQQATASYDEVAGRTTQVRTTLAEARQSMTAIHAEADANITQLSVAEPLSVPQTWDEKLRQSSSGNAPGGVGSSWMAALELIPAVEAAENAIGDATTEWLHGKLEIEACQTAAAADAAGESVYDPAQVMWDARGEELGGMLLDMTEHRPNYVEILIEAPSVSPLDVEAAGREAGGYFEEMATETALAHQADIVEMETAAAVEDAEAANHQLGGVEAGAKTIEGVVETGLERNASAEAKIQENEANVSEANANAPAPGTNTLMNDALEKISTHGEGVDQPEVSVPASDPAANSAQMGTQTTEIKEKTAEQKTKLTEQSGQVGEVNQGVTTHRETLDATVKEIEKGHEEISTYKQEKLDAAGENQALAEEKAAEFKEGKDELVDWAEKLEEEKKKNPDGGE